MYKELSSVPFYAICVWLAFTLLSCEEKRPLNIPPPSPELSPRGLYLDGLHFSGLGSSEIVERWNAAAARAFQDSTEISMPFQEMGYLNEYHPTAYAYRMTLRAGERLDMSLESTSPDRLFFLELYQMEEGSNWPNQAKPLLFVEPHQVDSASFEATEDGTYLLRLQGEILLSTRFTLHLSTQPTYSFFPVSGKGNYDIWSFFGDPRDGGRRKHKGVDIFARRGTPVVAAMDGTVRSVRNRGLGGKQVWLSDSKRRQSLYYAHLDSQLVAAGARVKAGDTLGWVGNTGNARNTAPHLHFSIYKRGRGAIDPYPFIARQKTVAPRVRVDSMLIGQRVRTKAISATLRSAPNPRSSTLLALTPRLPIQIQGATRNWLRVQTPSGHIGYLNSASIESLDRPIRRLQLETGKEIWTGVGKDAKPFAALSSDTEVDILGNTIGHAWIRTNDGQEGWMQID
ncbi:MAG: peptidoglycan DD-metalloendopeptidase family protein [Saprospiraceae bacterium]|nr:peptidoglycan DD-metalloendopeptidase family protein [Saprospiraceae bacterium]